MTSPRAALPALLGAQRPRICLVPPCASSSGDEALELCELAGLDLDPWQKFALVSSLGEREDGQWAAFEVAIVVPRQNGKGGILEARELVGLFLLGEKLITHSAHQWDTSLEAFSRLLEHLERTPDFERRIKKVSRAHGEEGITLKGGQRIRFRTRTRTGGRGFSGDCVILDEAMEITDTAHGSLLPTVSARPNPQIIYTGSAVDQTIHEHGKVLARVRNRAIKGDADLAYLEWSVPGELEDVSEVADSPEAWAESNPALGIRITTDYLAKERRALTDRAFGVERLGAGDWPDVDEDEDGLTREAWRNLADPASTAEGPVRLAFDVRPDRSRSAIGVAGRRADGHKHVAILAHDAGTNWVPTRLAELTKSLQLSGPVMLDEKSPAASLLPKLKDVGVKTKTIGAAEYAQACGAFIDEVNQGALRHLGTDELENAVHGAETRPLGDAKAWSRKNSTVDISPLVACTIASWGVKTPSQPLVAWR